MKPFWSIFNPGNSSILTLATFFSIQKDICLILIIKTTSLFQTLLEAVKKLWEMITKAVGFGTIPIQNIYGSSSESIGVRGKV